MSAHDDPSDISDIAAGWFARQRAGDMTAAETHTLDAWLDASAGHRDALDALYRAWERAELARRDPEILAWRERARGRSAWPLKFAARTAAVLVAMSLVGAGGYVLLTHAPLQPQSRLYNQEFQTDLGQRATFTLPDGSRVTLNTDSRLRTRASKDQRLVYLDKGQAFFRVAKDSAHPFIVKAGGRTITAIGTAFDVRVDPKRFEVTLVEGRVRVDTPAPHRKSEVPKLAAVQPIFQTTEMTAGAQLVAGGDSNWSVRQADTAKETSWLSGRLMFEDEPLGSVVAEFARYSDRKIILADPRLGMLRISGTFRSGDIDTFTRAMEKYGLARVQSQTEETVTLASF